MLSKRAWRKWISSEGDHGQTLAAVVPGTANAALWWDAAWCRECGLGTLGIPRAVGGWAVSWVFPWCCGFARFSFTHCPSHPSGGRFGPGMWCHTFFLEWFALCCAISSRVFPPHCGANTAIQHSFSGGGCFLFSRAAGPVPAWVSGARFGFCGSCRAQTIRLHGTRGCYSVFHRGTWAPESLQRLRGRRTLTRRGWAWSTFPKLLLEKVEESGETEYVLNSSFKLKRYIFGQILLFYA